MRFDRDVSLALKKQVLRLIETLTESNDLTEYAGLIVHPIVRLLEVHEMQTPAMDALTALLCQLDRKFEIFIPLVGRVLAKNRITHRRYDLLVAQLQKGTSNQIVTSNF